MASNTAIYVYAGWQGMNEPVSIGVLTAQQAKGKKAFSFAYDKDWLSSNIDGNMYRLNNIESWNASYPETCSVSLLKVIQTVR